MLSRTEAADIPDLGPNLEQQARIAALGITINQFQKTLQGRAIVERQELFILSGTLYQGYNQKAVECPEDQCSDDEIGAAHDIDGTKQRVLDTRNRRLAGRVSAREKESAERRKTKIATERDELELILLKRKIQALDPDEPADPDPDPDTEPIIPRVHAHKCDKCDKSYPTAKGLLGHKVGKKH